MCALCEDLFWRRSSKMSLNLPEKFAQRSTVESWRQGGKDPCTCNDAYRYLRTVPKAPQKKTHTRIDEVLSCAVLLPVSVSRELRKQIESNLSHARLRSKQKCNYLRNCCGCLLKQVKQINAISSGEGLPTILNPK